MAAPKDCTASKRNLTAWQESNKDRQRQMGADHAARINARNVSVQTAARIRELLRERFPGGSPQMAKELNIPRGTAGHLLYGRRTQGTRMTPQMAERLTRIILGKPYRPFRAQKARTKPAPQEKPWNLTQLLKDSDHLKDTHYMRRTITNIAKSYK